MPWASQPIPPQHSATCDRVLRPLGWGWGYRRGNPSQLAEGEAEGTATPRFRLGSPQLHGCTRCSGAFRSRRDAGRMRVAAGGLGSGKGACQCTSGLRS